MLAKICSSARPDFDRSRSDTLARRRAETCYKVVAFVSPKVGCQSVLPKSVEVDRRGRLIGANDGRQCEPARLSNPLALKMCCAAPFDGSLRCNLCAAQSMLVGRAGSVMARARRSLAGYTQQRQRRQRQRQTDAQLSNLYLSLSLELVVRAASRLNVGRRRAPRRTRRRRRKRTGRATLSGLLRLAASKSSGAPRAEHAMRRDGAPRSRDENATTFESVADRRPARSANQSDCGDTGAGISCVRAGPDRIGSDRIGPVGPHRAQVRPFGGETLRSKRQSHLRG